MILKALQSVHCWLAGRSGRWPAVRKAFLAGKRCAACGGTKGLVPHHVVPVHIDPSLELEVDNLLCLCEARGCHLRVGHCFLWSAWNPHAREDAALLLNRVQGRLESR